MLYLEIKSKTTPNLVSKAIDSVDTLIPPSFKKNLINLGINLFDQYQELHTSTKGQSTYHLLGFKHPFTNTSRLFQWRLKITRTKHQMRSRQQ
jgi:hypothetical protein